jgi:hypothetical protein
MEPTGMPAPARNRIAEAMLPLRNRALIPLAALIPPDAMALNLSLTQCACNNLLVCKVV